MAAFAGIAAASLSGCGPKAAAPEVGATAAEKPAQAQEIDPAVYRGAAIVRQVCAQCHDVGIDGQPPATEVGAPEFREIANRADTDAASLRQWLRTTHPTMPNYIFDEASAGDLVAYILSLRRPQ